METILNLLPLTDEERAAFLAAAPNEEHLFLPETTLLFHDGTATPEDVARSTVIIGNPPSSWVGKSTRLKWLQTWSAGVDPYLTPGSLPKGAILTSAAGTYGQSVSEHMLACLFSLMKRLPAYQDNQRAHIWRDEGKVKTLVDSTVLLLGAGDLGRSFAGLVKALGAHTVGLNRHPDRPVEHIDTLCHIDRLEEWLPKADVVASTLPQTPETIHILNARRLALMKPGAILLNAGRGSGVDTKALQESLRSGHLWGAALDVTETEPLPADDPLWDCPRLLLTPHIGGYTHLDVTVRRLAAIVLDNLKRYMAGEPLRNQML